MSLEYFVVPGSKEVLEKKKHSDGEKGLRSQWGRDLHGKAAIVRAKKKKKLGYNCIK